MKVTAVLIKSLKEQVRSYWVLLLTFAMGPFFIFVYYLITESSKPKYDLLFINNDKGCMINGVLVNHGQFMVDFCTAGLNDTTDIHFSASVAKDRNSAIEVLKKKDADALIIIPESFSQSIFAGHNVDSTINGKFEIIGDLTSIEYLISAVWANELVNEYIFLSSGSKRIMDVKETALGVSGTIDDFNMMVPGIIIVSLIMLMFTASIAFVNEVENKTIMRLKLSGVSSMEYLGGICLAQIMVGIISAFLTLGTAILLGFKYEGSLGIMIVLICLTSLSIIAFSLIIAAFTRSANEVLIVGNFPMFLFMFFTGAAFPIKSEAIFHIAGYPVTPQSLMTPVHAISALNKTLVMDLNFRSIVPEIFALLLLTILYFLTGAIIFRNRHLRMAYDY